MARNPFVRGCMATIVLVLLQGSIASSDRVRAAQDEPVPGARDAIRGVVRAFDQHAIVAIGEAHWLRQAGDFYIALVRDPEFQRTVDAIVIEFASGQSQATLDRYVAGEDVSVQDLRRIWRDTTKVAAWESPVYARWLAAIRDVNRGLPASRRLRVLAGDTAVDWSRIRTLDDWEALGSNDVSFAAVINEQVIAKHRKALVVLGANHLYRGGRLNAGRTKNTSTRVEGAHPDSTYLVLMASGNLARRAEATQDLEDVATPSLIALRGTSAGTLGVRRRDDPVTLESVADALLCLGPAASLVLKKPAAGSLEPAYLEELDRRAMIEWGDTKLLRQLLGPAGSPASSPPR